jgi:hypothetical protein
MMSRSGALCRPTIRYLRLLAFGFYLLWLDPAVSYEVSPHAFPPIAYTEKRGWEGKGERGR